MRVPTRPDGTGATHPESTKTYNGLEIEGVPAAGGYAVEYHFCVTCGSTVYWDFPTA